MRKFIITAELRNLEKQVSLGEISYSRMIELLNEKANKWHECKVNELNKFDFINKTNMKQTAVEWLVTELNQEINYIPVAQWDRIRDLIQRAKQMEKQQIIDAHGIVAVYNPETLRHDIRNGESYYEQTYNKTQ